MLLNEVVQARCYVVSGIIIRSQDEQRKRKKKSFAMHFLLQAFRLSGAIKVEFLDVDRELWIHKFTIDKFQILDIYLWNFKLIIFNR